MPGKANKPSPPPADLKGLIGLLKQLTKLVHQLQHQKKYRHRTHKDPRKRIVYWAWHYKRLEPAVHYTMDARRDDWLTVKPLGKVPLWTDCSGWVTLLYRLASLPDPNGLEYTHLGYTGTLLSNAAKVGKILTVPEAKPGDLIVYGPGTGEHVAVVVKAGIDPLTISHGQESGPNLVYVSQDGRMPQRVLRFVP